jgi:isopenicillin N synthase-like dioxygenase
VTSLHANNVVASALPVIDIANLWSPDRDARNAVAVEIREACLDTGFFYITGHGVPDDATAEIIAEARRFFAQPLDAKMTVHHRQSFCGRGYEPLKAQTLEPGTPPDLKESFWIDRDLPLDDPAVIARAYGCGPNQWPQQLPGWREALLSYQQRMQQVSAALLRGIALSLRLEEDALDGFCEDASAMLRLLHYPPQPANPLPDEKGCGAHTDWGAFTILLQDDAGGLQVRDRSGSWINAVPIPGTFVVNIGDLLARWTNDCYHSTSHRVVNVSGRDRISVPFFFMGKLDYVVTCVPTCLGAGETPKYEPTTSAQHLEMMARRTFG